MLTRFFGARRSFKEGLEVWRFAVFAGLAFTIPYYLVARFLGPEFPSLLGALVGLAIVVSGARAGWFLPKTTWNFESNDQWPEEWKGLLQARGEIPTPARPIGLFQAWSPYLIVAALLVITRTIDPITQLLRGDGLTLKWADILGTGINTSSQPFYLPGFWFIVTSAAACGIYRMSAARYRTAWAGSIRNTIGAASALIFAVPMVQVFINSQSGQYAQMPIVLADGVSSIVGSVWPLIAPTIGAMGAFIAGSNTISNMMFSLFQFGMAQKIGATESVVVALQAIGGAAGNMICVHNVVAASATVGLLGREGLIIRKTLIPMTGYLIFGGALGLVLTGGLGFNLGTILLIAVAAAIATLLKTAYTQERQQSATEQEPPKPTS